MKNHFFFFCLNLLKISWKMRKKNHPPLYPYRDPSKPATPIYEKSGNLEKLKVLLKLLLDNQFLFDFQNVGTKTFVKSSVFKNWAKNFFWVGLKWVKRAQNSRFWVKKQIFEFWAFFDPLRPFQKNFFLPIFESPRSPEHFCTKFLKIGP